MSAGFQGIDPRPDSIPDGPTGSRSASRWVWRAVTVDSNIMRRLLLVLLLLLGVAGALAWLALTSAPALRDGPLIVEIPAHQGLLGIADRLGQAGVVRSRA